MNLILMCRLLDLKLSLVDHLSEDQVFKLDSNGVVIKKVILRPNLDVDGKNLDFSRHSFDHINIDHINSSNKIKKKVHLLSILIRIKNEHC